MDESYKVKISDKSINIDKQENNENMMITISIPRPIIKVYDWTTRFFKWIKNYALYQYERYTDYGTYGCGPGTSWFDFGFAMVGSACGAIVFGLLSKRTAMANHPKLALGNLECTDCIEWTSSVHFDTFAGFCAGGVAGFLWPIVIPGGIIGGIPLLLSRVIVDKY